MEQLPENIWQRFKSAQIIAQISMKERDEIINIIAQLPEDTLDKLRHTLESIWQEYAQELMLINPDTFAGTFLSQS